MNDKKLATTSPVTAKNPPPPPPGKKESAMDTGSHAPSPVIEVKRNVEMTAAVENPAAPAASAAPAAPAAPAATAATAATAAPAPKTVVLVAGELTREQKLALFQDAFAAEKEVHAAEAAVSAANSVLSERIKTLISALGGKQGPWNVLGERGLRARFRGDVAYFLRDTDKVEDI